MTPLYLDVHVPACIASELRRRGVSVVTAQEDGAAEMGDPRLDLQSSLPVPMLDGNTLSLGFLATSPGVTYRAETSADLETWTTTGVTQTAPGADGRSTATVPLGDAQRFLRLAVEE